VAEMVRAAVQTGPRQIEIREFRRPVIGPDDGGLLRIEACGICGSEVEHYKGNLGRQSLPMVPGHEPLGIIEEVSEQAAARWGVKPGDRVAVEILIPCRSCDLCLAGRYMSCRNRIGSHGGSNPPERGLGLYGGFSEYIHLHPNSILHKVRGDIPAEIAVMFNPLGAGVLAATLPTGRRWNRPMTRRERSRRGRCVSPRGRPGSTRSDGWPRARPAGSTRRSFPLSRRC
jgi:threonine dehydrogenase-like Zn-dependent dehydrogenase